MITSITIQAVKDVPAIDVIGQYVNLRRHGANYTGLCPFHDERTPSFIVSPAKNRFKCFGCGAGGSVIQFVMDHEKKDFKEAVEFIAGISGITIGTEQRTQRTRWTRGKLVKKVFMPALYHTIPLPFLDISTHDIAINSLTVQIAAITGEDVVLDVVNEYKISLSQNWITYPQIDITGKLRTGKSVCYRNGHRANIKPSWIHNELKQEGKLPLNFTHKQCFTGEHLISNKAIAIVEGQSTMLFMAALGKAALKYCIPELKYFSCFTWIATGGSDGIGWKDEQVMQALKGKEVVLFPDAGFYDQWLNDAELMQEHQINVQVSQFIESKYNSGQLKYNEDLRDYFMGYADDIKEQFERKHLLTICSNDVLIAPITTYLSKDFNNTSVLYLETTKGKFDLLFDSEGELVQPGNERLITDIERMFEKKFTHALLDGRPCYVNVCLS